MLLAPGPFPVVAPVPATPPQTGTTFSDLAAVELIQLPVLETFLDAAIDPVFDFNVPVPDDGSTQLHDDADAIVQQLALRDFDGRAASIEPLKTLGDQGIIAAYQVIPGEAFQPVPPPDQYAGGGPPVITSNPLSITLNNLTRPGAADFAIGEDYQVGAQIALQQGGGGIYAGVQVLIFPWCDNVPQPSISIGVTDQYGFLTAQGTFLTDQVGNWGATFYSLTPQGGLIAGPTLSWVVGPAPGVPPGPNTGQYPAVRSPPVSYTHLTLPTILRV